MKIAVCRRLLLALLLGLCDVDAQFQMFGNGNPLSQIFGGGGGGGPHVIHLGAPRDASNGCEDEYQDLLPGHLLKAEHRGLDCYLVSIPKGLSMIAIEVHDRTHGHLLQLFTGRTKQGFPDQQHDKRPDNLAAGEEGEKLVIFKNPEPGELYLAIQSPMHPILQMMQGTIPFTIRLSFVKALAVGVLPPTPGVCNSMDRYAIALPEDGIVDVNVHTYNERFMLFASEHFTLGEPSDSELSHVHQQLMDRGDMLVLRLNNKGYPDRRVIVTVGCAAQNKASSFDICAMPPPISNLTWLGILGAYWLCGAILGWYLARPTHRHKQKSLVTSYALWLSFGLVGAHRFYLNRRTTGLVWLFTLGAGGLGLLLDGFLLPTFVLESTKVVQYSQVAGSYDEYDDYDANIIPMATLASRVTQD